MSIKTFIELEAAEKVTVEELMACLEEYVTHGLGISSRVVKKIVEEVDPSIHELDKLIASASKGFDDQIERKQWQEVGEYQDLLYYLQERSFIGMGM